jgi:hypothetical protein
MLRRLKVLEKLKDDVEQMPVSHYKFYENDYTHSNFIKKCLALLWISISNADE